MLLQNNRTIEQMKQLIYEWCLADCWELGEEIIYEKPLRLRYSAAYRFLHFLQEQDWNITLNEEKNLVEVWSWNYKKVIDFRMPLCLPPKNPEEDFSTYVNRLPENPDYYILLIQAGSSALACYQKGELFKHKSIRKYMVRAKQGKSQVTHLKSKGKSKAGSRLRLRNTITFFEDINTKLEEWLPLIEPQRILMSLPVRMTPLLYESKVPFPFPKNDSRFLKIPMDIKVPSFKELKRVNYFVEAGYVTFY